MQRLLPYSMDSLIRLKDAQNEQLAQAHGSYHIFQYYIYLVYISNADVTL